MEKVEDGFLKGISCDIFVGKKAGEDLKKSLKKAKKSVIIMAPFLSGKMISGQITDLLDRNVVVNIVTKENERLYPVLEKNFYKKHNVMGMEKWLLFFLNKLLILSYVVFGIFILELFFLYFFDFSFLNFPVSKNFFLSFMIVFFILIFISKRALKDKEFYFSERENFNFHILDENYNFHSKIYVIDNKFAYLGSLNFTDTGFILNHETCIRTDDKNLIKYLKNNVYKDLLKIEGISVEEILKKIENKKV